MCAAAGDDHELLRIVRAFLTDDEVARISWSLARTRVVAQHEEPKQRLAEDKL